MLYRIPMEDRCNVLHRSHGLTILHPASKPRMTGEMYRFVAFVFSDYIISVIEDEGSRHSRLAKVRRRTARMHPNGQFITDSR